MPPDSNRSLAQVAAELQADTEQSLIFERFLPAEELKQVCRDLGHSFRDRIYSPVITIWMFLGQTLSPDHSCRDAVHRLNAWRTEHSKPKADSNTTAYCEARQRLPEAVLDVAMAPYRGKETGENSLLQTIIGLLFPGEILLADRYYATFANVHRAYREGYDVVMRVHHKRKVDFRKGYKQGPCDQIVAYAKPANRPVWMSAEEYEDLEAFVLVRHLRYAVHQKGFRVRYLVLATTLLDASEHSVVDLADLYAQRWQVELDIRSLKTHMQMEYLRCKSPSMVRQEIYAHMISYNLIRDLIVRAALRYSTSPKFLSHAGSVQALNAFSEKLQAGRDRLAALEESLLESISEHPVGDRKPRIHPREIKRRPKQYKFMNRPRHATRRSAA